MKLKSFIITEHFAGSYCRIVAKRIGISLPIAGCKTTVKFLTLYSYMLNGYVRRAECCPIPFHERHMVKIS